MELIDAKSPLLRQVCSPVKPAEGGEISRKMIAWLRSNNKRARNKVRKDDRIRKGLEPAPLLGIGLAAPQLGIMKRVCVLLVNDRPLSLVNPRIVEHCSVTVPSEEVCLSLPGVSVVAQRYGWVIVETDNWPRPIQFGQRMPGDDAKFGGKDFWLYNVCVQHELAHLSGLLIEDFTETPYPEPANWDDWSRSLHSFDDLMTGKAYGYIRAS